MLSTFRSMFEPMIPLCKLALRKGFDTLKMDGYPLSLSVRMLKAFRDMVRSISDCETCLEFVRGVQSGLILWLETPKPVVDGMFLLFYFIIISSPSHCFRLFRGSGQRSKNWIISTSSLADSAYSRFTLYGKQL